MLAAYSGTIETFNYVKDLIPLQFQKTILNDRDSKNWTVMHYAAASEIDSAAKVERLFTLGGDINVRATWDNDFPDEESKMGQISPLMIATFRGNSKTVAFLLSKGAKYDEKEWQARTTFDYARYSQNSDVLEVLKNRINEVSCNRSFEEDRRACTLFKIFHGTTKLDDRIDTLSGSYYRLPLCDPAKNDISNILKSDTELEDPFLRHIPESEHLSKDDIGLCLYNDCDIELNIQNYTKDSCCNRCEKIVKWVINLTILLYIFYHKFY